MLWSDFTGYVDEHLSVDAVRRGTAAFKLRHTKNAVLSLQRYIRAFRQNHTTTYTQADLTVYGKAHEGSLPSFAKPKAFRNYSVAAGDDQSVKRNRMDFWPWNGRQMMIDGFHAWNPAIYTISPYGRNFMIYPQLITGATQLEVVWDGLKIDWADGDTVPFPQEASAAVGAYVKAKFIELIDKNPRDAAMEMQTWASERLALYRDANEALDAEGEDEEYSASSTPPGILVSGVRPDITSWATLAAISTIGAAVPVILIWTDISTGMTMVTRLKAGTDATDTSNGVQRPNDYSASHQFVWYQQGL